VNSAVQERFLQEMSIGAEKREKESEGYDTLA